PPPPEDPADRLVLRQLTDELMFEIRELSGQKYVDEYATRKHEAMPSQPTAIVLDRGNGERAERVATGCGAMPAARYPRHPWPRSPSPCPTDRRDRCRPARRRSAWRRASGPGWPRP